MTSLRQKGVTKRKQGCRQRWSPLQQLQQQRTQAWVACQGSAALYSVFGTLQCIWGCALSLVVCSGHIGHTTHTQQALLIPLKPSNFPTLPVHAPYLGNDILDSPEGVVGAGVGAGTGTGVGVGAGWGVGVGVDPPDPLQA